MSIFIVKVIKISKNGDFGDKADVRVVISLVVVWSFDIISRKSIYGSIVCYGVVEVMNIV